MSPPIFNLFFFFNDTATTEIYTLSLHDALPIFDRLLPRLEIRGQLLQSRSRTRLSCGTLASRRMLTSSDRKSTRLNSSHVRISYAVFCLKKKNYSYICARESE